MRAAGAQAQRGASGDRPLARARGNAPEPTSRINRFWRDPGQTMKNIGDLSIATATGREDGHSRHVKAGPKGSRRSLRSATRRERRDRLPPALAFRMSGAIIDD
ncbi:hypothetical protein ASD54_25230 [Rhizobium sp. Root149]|nr:hypothetical protein ASD54_25230 [Rhizobium sp. Root149]